MIKCLSGCILVKAHMQHVDREKKWTKVHSSAVCPRSSSSFSWLNHRAFILVWLAATRALWTPGSVKGMYNSQASLCKTLPGNEAEKKSYRGKGLSPLNPSPLCWSSERATAAMCISKGIFLCIIVSGFLQFVMGNWCVLQLCVSVLQHAQTCKNYEKIEVWMTDTRDDEERNSGIGSW